MMTSTWPTVHGVRDNFVADTETHLSMPDLPKLLVAGVYSTAAVGDWAASDLGKFHFGFQETSLAEDQWNLKYLLRQGPKDLRLFLTLFTHNRFGKTFMLELYYLAGVPLTEEMGRDTRYMILKIAVEATQIYCKPGGYWHSKVSMASPNR